MVKESFSPQYDQHDPKLFKESLGSFGTTTKPGGNQLQELQAKIRQGVKHVELHLAGTGKGQFNVQDVPDKYGFEQRRTIMQLAKLNKQSLSVHGTFDVTTFSGLGNNGFDEALRANSVKEIDETIKFAAETAKGGAVVFHLQGDGVATNRSEQNLSKEYLEYLKNNKDPKLKAEYDRIRKDYFSKNPMHRRFVENIEQEKEVRDEFSKLNYQQKLKFEEKAKTSGLNPWEEYFYEKNLDKMKLSPDLSPLIVVGDKIQQVDRRQEFIDIDVITGKSNVKLNEYEKNLLKSMGIDLEKKFNIQDYQKATAYFTNGLPREFKGKISEKDFNSIQKKILVEYGNLLEKNDFMQAHADKEFFDKLNNTQIEMTQMQKRHLETKYEMFKDDIKKVKQLEEENRNLIDKIENIQNDNDLDKAARDAIKQDIAMRNSTIQQIIYNVIGINEYQEVSRYDETIAQINKQLHDLSKTVGNTKALTDTIFEKNTTALGHLGIKALKYQLELKKTSKTSSEEIKNYNSKIENLQKQYNISKNEDERNKINNDIMKLKYQRRLLIGTKDYNDIDLIERPLYVAPENMLPGYGSLSSLEEFKATIRIGQEEFAKKILSNEIDYKKIKEDYEKETGIKIKTHEDALKLAKRHIGGTFDNAHAGAWFKHFKKEEGESDENRIDRFNKWLNTQAEEMAREGIIKHVHFNDTQGKDDDHNLLGSGILDIHDLRERLRKAGVKEALIVEAGGRGADSIMHVLNAFDIFNPTLNKQGYRLSGDFDQGAGTGVSDWISVKRAYQDRLQYSHYGMNYNTFRHVPNQNQSRGGWSGTGFL